jgi:hypothetical protein
VVAAGVGTGAAGAVVAAGVGTGALACRWWWRRWCLAGEVLDAPPEAVLAGLLLTDAGADGAGVPAVRGLAEAWVEPGRIAATTPAVTTPAAPTVAVTARKWPWLRCRLNTAARTSARRWLMLPGGGS